MNCVSHYPNACCTRYSNVNCMKAYYFSLAHIFTYKTTLSQHYYRYQWNKTFSTHAHTYTFTKGAKKRNARSLSCSYDKSYSYLLNGLLQIGEIYSSHLKIICTRFHFTCYYSQYSNNTIRYILMARKTDTRFVKYISPWNSILVIVNLWLSFNLKRIYCCNRISTRRNPAQQYKLFSRFSDISSSLSSFLFPRHLL